jgi:hypothetical protein
MPLEQNSSGNQLTMLRFCWPRLTMRYHCDKEETVSVMSSNKRCQDDAISDVTMDQNLSMTVHLNESFPVTTEDSTTHLNFRCHHELSKRVPTASIILSLRVKMWAVTEPAGNWWQRCWRNWWQHWALTCLSSSWTWFPYCDGERS